MKVLTPPFFELRARLLAEQHGCKIRPYGAGWRIVGRGVDLLVADLASLRASDLEPALMLRNGRAR